MTKTNANSQPAVTVIGAGAWGTALALAARRTATMPAVTIWAHEPDVAAQINGQRRNDTYLPGFDIPAGVRASHDLADAAQSSSLLLVAVPAQHVRGIAQRLAPHLRPGSVLVSCAKGLELESGKLMTDILAELCPQATLAVLSGPTFAAEVAAGKPTAVTLACPDETEGRRLIAALGSVSLRPYLSRDLIGAQVGGAVKNVIAIAAGIVEGRRLGDNARAALITRGLAEIMRLGDSLGGTRQTLMGLSGLGDLTLTCGSVQSRNMSLGVALGRGKPLAELLAASRAVIEGVPSAAAVHKVALSRGIDMPIVAAVNSILHAGADITATIAALLERPFKTEM